MKKIIISMVVIAVVGLISYFVYDWYANRLKRNPDFAYGNGRIEATEINIAARLAGKVEYVRVLEGQRVEAGQVLVVMQTNVLVAKLERAEATLEQAKAKVELQTATIARMKSELESSKVVEENRRKEYERQKKLYENDSSSQKHADNAKTSWETAKASVVSAEAAIREAEANLKVAKAEVSAAAAEISSIKADIDDSILRAPLKGRIQYRIAEPGEVLSAGGRAINMVDLTDVYITFFLPEQTAGKVKIGSEVRIVLDAMPKFPIPAKVTYVADVAQFTPKTVETEIERQKLMFRIKAHIDREYLEKFIDLVKTGLPGVAWVKLNDKAAWPKELEVNPEMKKRVEKAREAAKKNAAVTPGTVITSETGKQTRATPEPLKKYQGASKPNATKEEVRDQISQAARDVNADKQQTVEENVKKAKAAGAAKQQAVEKSVKEAKKDDASDRRAPAKIGAPVVDNGSKGAAK